MNAGFAAGCSGRESEHFLPRGLDSRVKVFGEIGEMDPFRTLLARLNPDKRNRDFARTYLLHQLSRIEVREVIPANIVNRDYGLAAILRHEEERCVHLRELTSRNPKSTRPMGRIEPAKIKPGIV
jgi:hypothetical protein